MLGKSLNLILILAWVCAFIGPFPIARAQPLLGLPEPGKMVSLSPSYEPAMLRGLVVHRNNPFVFDFIVDQGQRQLAGQALKEEGNKLIKYFLAALAIPQKDLWVNLSPYESVRIAPDPLSETGMGRDLLAEDYMLKQITASLVYPRRDLGRSFWNKVYAAAFQKFGTTGVEVGSFDKVWIMADKAEVYEHNQTAFVVKCHLKVMLQEDYLAVKNKGLQPGIQMSIHAHKSAAEQAFRQIILPQLEEEVNNGRNFAALRQICSALILAGWYKKNLKAAVLNQVYADKGTITGIDLKDKTLKSQIYRRYLEAYKKGVFNYIEERHRPRKYFSGGFFASSQMGDPVVTTKAIRLAPVVHGRSLVDFAMKTQIETQADAPMATKQKDFMIEHKRLIHMGMASLVALLVVVPIINIEETRAVKNELSSLSKNMALRQSNVQGVVVEGERSFGGKRHLYIKVTGAPVMLGSIRHHFGFRDSVEINIFNPKNGGGWESPWYIPRYLPVDRNWVNPGEIVRFSEPIEQQVVTSPKSKTSKAPGNIGAGPADGAMHSAFGQTPGGIDLSMRQTQWTGRKGGPGVQISRAQLIEGVERNGIKSLKPEIYKIVPISNIWSHLGIAPPEAAQL